MAEPPFDRGQLTADASLNKLVVSIGEYAGRSGSELLSRDALAELVPTLDPGALSDQLPAHPAVQTVAAEVGRRLAVLVATLRRGPHRPPLSGLTDGRLRSLEEWMEIDDVLVGGGLVAGAWGDLVLAAARLELESLDAPVTTLTLARHAPYLGLLGAARSGRFGDGDHLVIDGGQSAVKRAIVTVSGSRIRRLQLLPSVTFREGIDITAVIEDVLAQGPPTSATHRVPCSIAAYVRNGRPIVDRASPYELLDGAPSALLDRLVLIHDGSAAWRGTERTTSSAVIVMGTWLGVGMGPQPNVALTALSDDFEIDASV